LVDFIKIYWLKIKQTLREIEKTGKITFFYESTEHESKKSQGLFVNCQLNRIFAPQFLDR